MIYRMACDIQANLQARKWPVTVEYARRVQRTGRYSMLIAVSRDDRDTPADEITSARGLGANPHKQLTRAIGAHFEVFAKSNLSGARRNEHEHECDDLVDALLTALYDWVSAAKAGPVEVVEAGYVPDADLDTAERGAGVVYRLRVRVLRGVARKDYGGGAAGSATLAEVGNASTGAILVRPNGSTEVVPDPAPGD